MALLLILGLSHVASHNVAQTCTIEEGACVFKYIFRSVVENLPDEQLQESIDFGVLPEVSLVGHPELQLLLLDLVLLSSQDSLHANQVVVVLENVITLGRVLDLIPVLGFVHFFAHAIFILLLNWILLIRHLYSIFLILKIIIILSFYKPKKVISCESFTPNKIF